MTEPTPAEELRAAAKRIRELAALVPPPPWYPAVHDVTTHDGLDVVATTGLTVRAQYVASMHPGVALAVAGWLDSVASRWLGVPAGPAEPEPEDVEAALAVARAFMGIPRSEP